MTNYFECPICGHLTDDGMIVKTKKRLYLVCFDCTESVSDEEIAEIINRKENKIGSVFWHIASALEGVANDK